MGLNGKDNSGDHVDSERRECQNEDDCMNNRGKHRQKRQKNKCVLKCVIGHRWRTCLCSTFRFYDVWMLSKLLLGGKDHKHSVKFFFSLSLSCCEVLVIVISLLSCCYKRSELKNSPSSKTACDTKIRHFTSAGG